MKKKILLILTEFPPDIGGMQTHALLLSRYLYMQGYELKLYTYRRRASKKECAKIDNSLSFPVCRRLSRISYYYNIRILSKEVKNWQPQLIYASTIFYGSLSDLHKIPVICRSVGNDIMRPWIVYPYQFGSFFAANEILERVLYKIFRKLPRPEWAENLLRGKRLALTVQNAQQSDKILANSHFTRGLLINSNIKEKNIEIVVGGVDFSFFQRPSSFSQKKKNKIKAKYNISKNATIIATACRLVDKKGIDFLLNAMHQIYYKISDLSSSQIPPNLHLLIIGDGRRFKKFLKMRDVLHLQDKVTFTGSVSYYDMPQFYWLSDIFVLASIFFVDKKTGLTDAETMGRVLCEANAAGLPVIASRSGGIPSVIRNNFNGLLFEENDFPSFLQALKRMMNPVLKEKLIGNGITIAQNKFDWPHILAKHEEHFHALLKKNR